MNFYLIIFIGITLLVLGISHLPIYFSFVKFFSITKPFSKLIFLLSLLALTASYIASSILIRYKENYFTNFLNYLSSVWLGILANLLITLIAVWIIILALKIIRINPNLMLMGLLTLFLASTLSIYGLWEAKNIVVRDITVKIKNLPDAWVGKTAVQLSDVHIGNILKKDFMDRIVNKIIPLNPDIMFITGDLFDGMGDHIQNSISPLNNIKAPLGKYLITGNHEIYLGIDNVKRAIAETDIQFLRDQNTLVEGMNIIGIDYVNIATDTDKFANHNRRDGDILNLKTLFSENQPNLALYHEPRHIEIFKQLGTELLLTGHTHRGQMWPFRYITHSLFKGYDFGFFQEGNFNLYASNGVGTWGPPMRTLNKPEIIRIKFEQY